jgi:probable HAF family extracellular repeat protein
VNKIIVAAAVFAAIPTIASAQQAASCSFHDYYIPNSDYTSLGAVNNAGHFVGSYSYNGQQRAFYFNGTRSDIAVPGGLQTELRGINNGEELAGDYYDAKLNRQRGFVYQQGQYFTFDFPWASRTIASAVNDSGAIVGEFWNASGGHGFLHYQGKMVAIDHPNALSSWATGINNSQQISGTWQDSSGVNHGFLYSNGAFTDINFPGADNTSALGISPNGTVIGNYFKNGSGRGFIYLNGIYKDASFPGGSQSTVPVGMNSNATTTGGWITSSGAQHGFTANNCH